MARIWGWIATAFGFLLAALLYVSGQRDRAREAASKARHKAQAHSAVREVDRAIDNARAQVRDRAGEVQREHDDYKSAGTRPHLFGDPRLRDDRDD